MRKSSRTFILGLFWILPQDCGRKVEQPIADERKKYVKAQFIAEAKERAFATKEETLLRLSGENLELNKQVRTVTQQVRALGGEISNEESGNKSGSDFDLARLFAKNGDLQSELDVTKEKLRNPRQIDKN